MGWGEIYLYKQEGGLAFSGDPDKKIENPHSDPATLTCGSSVKALTAGCLINKGIAENRHPKQLTNYPWISCSWGHV